MSETTPEALAPLSDPAVGSRDAGAGFSFPVEQHRKVYNALLELGRCAVATQRITDHDAASAAVRACLHKIEQAVSAALSPSPGTETTAPTEPLADLAGLSEAEIAPAPGVDLRDGLAHVLAEAAPGWFPETCLDWADALLAGPLAPILAERATLTAERDAAQTEAHQRAQVVDRCQQVAGKALGYPWFKDDQHNFPGATEENGVCIGEHWEGKIIEGLAAALAAAEARAEALAAALIGVLPPKLLGEGQDLSPDDFAYTRMTWGCLARARAILAQHAPGRADGTEGGADGR